MSKKTFVYISSWSHGTGECGLCVYEQDPETGELSFLQRVDSNVSFNVTLIDRKRNILYALNEGMKLPELRAGGGGQIYVYHADPETGLLTFIGQKATWCPNPSFITLDAEGQYAIVSNHASSAAATQIVQDAFGKYHLNIEYDDSVVELFEVQKNGMIGELLDVDKHVGNGPEPRQLRPRPHSAVMSPDGRLFAVCDKGNDTVTMYQIDRDKKKLTHPAGVWHCESGSLPRYCVFHPVLPYFYHNNECSMDLCAYRYDADGRLSPIGKYSALPDGHVIGKGKHEQQGLCIHPSGTLIYDIVRGPNTVAAFQVKEDTGSVQLIQSQKVPDSWPRGCAISENGRFLIVCGLEGGKIFVYPLDENGRLLELCSEYAQPSAAYVTFWTP